ncbi:MAG: hypothetical protein ABUL64_02525 [Singulisphaera sp.]
MDDDYNSLTAMGDPFSFAIGQAFAPIIRTPSLRGEKLKLIAKLHDTNVMPQSGGVKPLAFPLAPVPRG